MLTLVFSNLLPLFQKPFYLGFGQKTWSLEQNKDKKAFAKDIRILCEQMENWEKKKGMVKDLLLQKFSSTELSYGKFSTVIEELEKVFYMNIRSIINKINIFDQEDYDELKRPKAKESFSKDFIEETWI